jgi:flagellar hook-length control protein FliK
MATATALSAVAAATSAAAISATETVDGQPAELRTPLAREDRRVADAQSGALRMAALDSGASGDRAIEGVPWLAQAVRQGTGEGAASSTARQGAVPLEAAGNLLVPATGSALGGATAADSAVPLAPYVSTPVDDPRFREALGAQVNLLARDGVQSAELRLNPADMGPVSVQITMNGDQATVDFGADRAQTRQAIEAGWAELAASLRESGFTLSGGGVSSRHARDRAGGGDDGTGRTRRLRVGDALADDTGSESVTVLRGRPRAGAALDLYA